MEWTFAHPGTLDSMNPRLRSLSPGSETFNELWRETSIRLRAAEDQVRKRDDRPGQMSTPCLAADHIVSTYRQITRGTSGYRTSACNCWVTQNVHRVRAFIAEGFDVGVRRLPGTDVLSKDHETRRSRGWLLMRYHGHDHSRPVTAKSSRTPKSGCRSHLHNVTAPADLRPSILICHTRAAPLARAPDH